MDHQWEKQKIAVVLILCCSWWALTFPELAVPEDTIQIWKQEQLGDRACMTEWTKDQYFEDLLSANFGEVKLRSRLLAWIREILEKDNSI